MLWRHILSNKGLQDNAILVAIDLPGYGGSDSFVSYGATSLLEALTEAILAIRKIYDFQTAEAHSKKLHIVAHDWGCLLSFQLAAEAPQLADRFIMSNAPFVSAPAVVISYLHSG